MVQRYNCEVYEREDGTCEPSMGYDEDGGEFCYYSDVEKLESKILELQEFAIWMTGCGYDFSALTYFRAQRDRLLLDYKHSENSELEKSNDN